MKNNHTLSSPCLIPDVSNTGLKENNVKHVGSCVSSNPNSIFLVLQSNMPILRDLVEEIER